MAASTPLPHASPELLWIINLRGMVIPTIDLSRKLNALRRDHGEKRHRRGGGERHAVGIGGRSVTDMLSVTSDQLQPTPSVASSFDISWCAGIITHISHDLFSLDLQAMFASSDALAA